MKVNFVERTIELTAKEMNQASKPQTREYQELLSVMRDLPHFEIRVNHPNITRNANRGLTYTAMSEYISQNAPEQMEAFRHVMKLGSYPITSKWFRAMFPEYYNQEDIYARFALAA